MANSLELFRRPWVNPFKEMAKKQSAFDRMLEDFQEMTTSRALDGGFNFAPTCDIEETNTAYHLKFDLPGIPKDQVKIEYADNQLTVCAERKEEKTKDSRASRLSEINYGSYMRSLTLPAAVDDKKIDAKYDNGVLSITIPKAESSKAKKIEIH